VPVADRLPSTSRTFDAFVLAGIEAAVASSPGSVSAAVLKLPCSSRTSPFGWRTDTAVS
jgi:hypothetical protein